MQQDGNIVEQSTVVNAGGGVFIGQYDKVIMAMVIGVMVVCVINVLGICFVVLCVSIPKEVAEPLYWLVAP